MSDDLIRNRSRRMLRLGLLAILVILIAAIALLLPWSNDAIGVEAAEGLLQHFKERGESYSHITSIIGRPDSSILNDGRLICIWRYSREGLLEEEVTRLRVTFESEKIMSVAKEKLVVSGSALWNTRWERMKKRLMIGK